MWRALHGPSRTLLDDVVIGSALGLVFSLGSYLLARLLGIPALALTAPAVVLILFAAHPKLRGHWRARNPEKVPRWFSWAISAVTLVSLSWIAWRAFTTHPFTGDAASSPYLDIPYHLALAGELKNHAPPQVPYLAGEPLNYHWFAHAHLAASSWGTGIELEVLLLRLSIVPLLAITIIGSALLAVRLSSRWWTGIAATVIGFWLTAISPFQFTEEPIVFETRALDDWWWQSPTQAFGAALFAGTLLLLVSMLRNGARAGSWLLLAIFLIALAGSKGTFLPVLLVGILAVIAVERFNKKLWNRTALIAAAQVFTVLALAMLVVYRGQSDGMSVRPLHNMGRMPAVVASHLGMPWLPMRPWVLLIIGSLTVLIWLMRATGALGLGKKEQRTDPLVALLVGVTAAGVGATIVFAHTGFSEYYFLRSVAPLIGVASACGLAALTDKHMRLIPPLLAGAALTGALYWLSPTQATLADESGRAAALWTLAWPYLVLLTGASITAATLWHMKTRAVAIAALASVLIGGGLFGVAREWTGIIEQFDKQGTSARTLPSNATPLPHGAREASRWLRAHSDPDAIIATNAHCRGRDGQGRCDNRAFWISGYSERRVLIEGWGYTERTGSNSKTTPFMYRPYWNPAKLAANDAAFTTPSDRSIATLRDTYHVTWLFVDLRESVDFSALSDNTTLRYRSGDCAIFEIR